MNSAHREYRGVQIHAHTEKSGVLFVPAVTLTRHNGDGVKEIKWHSPYDKGVATEQEALSIAMEYGLSLLDGKIAGFDPSTLF
jgi:hypothetical protein